MSVKKVATAEQLKARALKSGATLTSSDGNKFNAAKKKVARPVVRKRKKPDNDYKKEIIKEELPPVEPQIEEKPTGPDAGAVLLAEKLDEAARMSAQAMKDLKMQISLIQLQAADPPTDWVFDIIRDEKGNLKQIKASSSSIKKLDS